LHGLPLARVRSAPDRSSAPETTGADFHNEQEIQMQQQIVTTFSPVAISAVIVAIIMAVSRLAPFTKPYWTFFPKVVQTWLPALVAGLPAAVNAFGSVQTWLDFAQALLIVGTIPLALVAPGMSSPHNDPAAPPPADKPKNGGKPEPPSVPPLAAAGLLLLCWLLPGCGAFASSDPHYAQAAIFIADAASAVSAAEALLPSLKLDDKETASARELVARARAALSAAAAADNGAKDLSAEQLDASLADFRTAWADIQLAIAPRRTDTTDASPMLPTPVCMGSVNQ